MYTQHRGTTASRVNDIVVYFRCASGGVMQEADTYLKMKEDVAIRCLWTSSHTVLKKDEDGLR